MPNQNRMISGLPGRRQLLQAACASGLWMLGARAGACDFSTSTLRVTHPWTRETAEGATSCIICMKFDLVQQDDRLIGVETALASGAEMGGIGASGKVDFALSKGRETALSESGTYLRLTGLRQPLDVGRTYPIRLLFEVGGAMQADLSVDYARFA